MSPCRTNSRASRNLIFCLPSHVYCFDEAHVNISLQSLLGTVVEDLNRLSSVGLHLEGEDLGSTGDLLLFLDIYWHICIYYICVNARSR